MGEKLEFLREVKEEGKKHQVKTISMVKSVEEARDAIANGYALSVCSNYGFSSRRSEHGIAKKSGSWNHAMSLGGYGRFSQNIQMKPYFLIQN